MIPKKLNKLQFIELTSKNLDGRQLAKFQCNCGNIHETQLRYYLNGKTKSCGCEKYLGILNYKPSMSATYSSNRTFTKAYSQLKSNAKKRNIAFRITEDECKALLYQPCFYCNQEFDTPISLDRIDNSKPYSILNVKPCCQVCNRMKLNLSIDEFLNHVAKITVAHNKLGEFSGSPEVGNTEPSLNRNILEGATTRNRDLPGNAEVSNVSKSAEPLVIR